MLVRVYNTYKQSRGAPWFDILYYYYKKSKNEVEIENQIETEKAEQIWELQKINLETDLREANDLGAFKPYEY